MAQSFRRNTRHGGRGAASPGSGRPATVPLQLLQILVEEQIQQIFQLLALIYRPEDICLIYSQLRESEAHIRADAIELLDNLLDPGMRTMLFPILDENRFLERIDAEDAAPLNAKDTYRLLREGIWDHHPWLSVVILTLVSRHRLDPLREDLARALDSPSELLRLAAKAAQQLAA